MNNTTAYSTAADQAYRIICDSILSGALQPGKKLSRRDMAKLTGVSIIPVIEALHRLENEGLVESRPHWGSRVILPTKEYIRDKYALREAIECQVVKMLCGTIKESHVVELMNSARHLDSLEQRGDVEAFWDEHYLFHVRMAEYTNCSSLVDSLRRINLFYLLKKAELEAQKILNEIPADNHERIIKAIVDGNSVNAEKVMQEHVYQSGLVSWEEVHNNGSGMPVSGGATRNNSSGSR